LRYEGVEQFAKLFIPQFWQIALRGDEKIRKAQRHHLKEAVAGGQRQQIPLEIIKGEHVARILTLPASLEPLSIAKDRDRPFAPDLNLNGEGAVGIFNNICVLVMGRQYDDILKIELGTGGRIYMGNAIAPTFITAGSRIILPEGVGGSVTDLNG
jgi:hypothetical protein